ncbi:hypothetical protein DVH24_032280 [Malus domestica]|uniref:Uncharacterized protein n=1 Tax=Malus domestica TaxID=3750 RepID=A0A498J7Y8_MALDO|nr:hypothetical protein DVH24_032280 [Malus domestica]
MIAFVEWWRVEELLINLWMTCGVRFDLPNCVFKCDSSRTLTLSKASYIPISPQPAEDTKSRFCYWSSFASHFVSNLCGYLGDLDSDWAVDLFSDASFPFLENLAINTCKGMTDLKISCSKLEDVQVITMIYITWTSLEWD